MGTPSRLAHSSIIGPQTQNMGLINHPRPITLQLAAHLGTFAPLLSSVFPLALNAGPSWSWASASGKRGLARPALAPPGTWGPHSAKQDPARPWSVGSRRRGHAALDNAHAALARRGRSVAGWVPRGVGCAPQVWLQVPSSIAGGDTCARHRSAAEAGAATLACGAGQSWKCRPVTQWQSQSLVVPPCEHQSPTWQNMIGF